MFYEDVPPANMPDAGSASDDTQTTDEDKEETGTESPSEEIV